LTQQYERLRAHVLAGAQDGPGLAALRHKGLRAWLALSQVLQTDGGCPTSAPQLLHVAPKDTKPEPASVFGQPDNPATSVPAAFRGEFVRICAGLVLGRVARQSLATTRAPVCPPN